MGRRRSVSTISGEESNELVSSLISGTKFEFVTDESGSLSDRPFVETPIIALNCLLGGGLPLGSIIEVYGPNASGKSSMMYETLGNFQRKFSNGVAFIVDTESSTDETRLKQLGVDPLRAPRTGAPTIEDGFDQITSILKKMTDDDRYSGFPVMIMWDTLANSGIRSQIDDDGDYNRVNGMDRARIIKYHLTKLFPLIEKLNVLIVILNQATTDISGFRPGMTSAGGNALQHDIHIRLECKGSKTEYDGVFATTKNSKVSLKKSKISPIMDNFHSMIDITKGGVIDKETSFAWWMADLGIFNGGAWWSWKESYYERYKPYIDKFEIFAGCARFRQGAMYELAKVDSNFIDLLKLIWIDMVSDRYELQREVCKELRDETIAKLMMNLGVTQEEIDSIGKKEEVVESITTDELTELSDILGSVPVTEENTNQELN